MFLEQLFRKVSSNGPLKVLDLCAAPGGKSTHLSSLIGPEGLLVSNEVIRSRASMLAENITRWGSTNTIVTQNDPSVFGNLPGYFDVILVDAPCSGEGMFRDETARQEWSAENAFHCSERQKRILMDVWPALKKNGILIYSTCTFNPEENELNIKWLTGKQVAEPIQIDIGSFPAVLEIFPEGIPCYLFHPDKIRGEGLFFSVVRKNGGNDNKSDPVKKAILTGAGKEQRSKAELWTDFRGDRIVRLNEDIVALHGNLPEMQILFRALKVIKAGTRIFTIKKKDLLPSYEIALSQALKNDAFPSMELDLRHALDYLKRGNPEKYGAPRGWFLAKFKEINLGFANNIGTRINNYYPTELRIRMSVPENPETEIINWEE